MVAEIKNSAHHTKPYRIFSGYSAENWSPDRFNRFRLSVEFLR
jgi:hypothetical protein